MSELTRYGYRDAMSGFFEFPTENARRILPAHLEPVEDPASFLDGELDRS